MTDVRLHPEERDRLDSLASYQILDTAPDDDFDALAELAARVCATPFAAVTLVGADRQWSKARTGSLDTDGPREASFCSDTVARGRMLVVPDAAREPRYQDHPLTTGGSTVHAYAGAPLVGRDGLPLGALCVMDRQARAFSHDQLKTLRVLARQAVVLLEQWRHDRGQGMFGADVVDESRDPVRLRQALDAGQLIPHYQPLVDIASGAPYSLEALLRWQHPTLGTLAPASFLPGIESSAIVVPVGRAVLDTALADLAQLGRQEVTLPGGVAVNVASAQLARPGLARDVIAALDRHGVDGSLLSLEVTESTALPDEGLAVRELRVLADEGVHIVIDDFGVGWSNLSRVLSLPVDAIKLDRSLAGRVVADPRAAAMVDATFRLAGELGLGVVAEGVQTDAVRRRLVVAGCRWAQGRLFSPPVAAADLPRVLRDLAAGIVAVPPSMVEVA